MSDPRLNSLIGADSEDDAENDAYRAEVNGDEAVGGSTAVPSQNDTENLAQAAGIVVDDDTPLDTEEMLEERDLNRWELDPESAIDREEAVLKRCNLGETPRLDFSLTPDP